jgi:hypothetical protein
MAIEPTKSEMEDVSDRIANAGRAEDPASSSAGHSALAMETSTDSSRALSHPPVTREEVAILRAFLSTEIDAIIYADEQLPRD